MHFLTFDEVEHKQSYCSFGRYAIDWETAAELKYKEPIGGIRVYENGVILVHRNGYRDPDWRSKVRAMFDLNFELTKDLIGMTFTNPDTGAVVPRSAILHEILLHDTTLGRVYCVGNWALSDSIRFVSEHAQPMGSLPVTYRVRNKARGEERLAALHDHFELGRTLLAMKGGEMSRYRRGVDYEMRRVLSGEAPPPTNLRAKTTQDLCYALAEVEPQAKRLIQSCARDVFTPKHLLIKEK
jgi:hypothetical protein